MIKYLPFIFFGLFIDGLQAALAFGFLAMGSALTAATPGGGALLGCGIGWASSSNAASGAVNCGIGAVAGAIASPMGMPLGIGLGMAADICISLSFGVMLILALSFFGMFYP